MAAPRRGDAAPLYSPPNPSPAKVFFAQSIMEENGNLPVTGSGCCVCKRIFIVSNGCPARTATKKMSSR